MKFALQFAARISCCVRGGLGYFLSLILCPGRLSRRCCASPSLLGKPDSASPCPLEPLVQEQRIVTARAGGTASSTFLAAPARLTRYFSATACRIVSPPLAMPRVLLCLALLCTLTPLWATTTPHLEQQRRGFVAAERALDTGNDAQFASLAASLRDYPLYPYLRYRWLRQHLSESTAIENFLRDHAETRYANRLRKVWLAHLAAQRQWSLLLRHYRADLGSEADCLYHWAQYQTGQRTAALRAAASLWHTGQSLPEACDPLFKVWMDSPSFSTEHVWQRFALALDKRNVRLARYLMRYLPATQTEDAAWWLRVDATPALAEQASQWQASPRRGRIFGYAIERLASQDVERAVALWDAQRARFPLDDATQQRVEQRLALHLAYRKHPSAYDRLQRLPDHDEKVREWRVRAALSQQNWPGVLAALDRLTADEQQRPNWRYWRARALTQTGQLAASHALWQTLAHDRSFHGFLAADHIGKTYHLAHRPVTTLPEHVLFQHQNFRMAREWRALGRDELAKQEWWHGVKTLRNDELITAAKLAERWQWPQVAIFTLARADYWDDLDVRFPLLYLPHVERFARQHDLPPALVYGVIRRESALDVMAHSPVGAKGLMQLMPTTAQQIAKTLGEPWSSEQVLYDVATNLRYGTYYYRKMLDQFAGHHALAAAAYNAGPQRVKRWLPREQRLPADIWIETIPFTETRNYVTSVLAYAMIYQQRLGHGPLSLKQWLRDVTAG